MQILSGSFDSGSQACKMGPQKPHYLPEFSRWKIKKINVVGMQSFFVKVHVKKNHLYYQLQVSRSDQKSNCIYHIVLLNACDQDCICLVAFFPGFFLFQQYIWYCSFVIIISSCQWQHGVIRTAVSTIKHQWTLVACGSLFKLQQCKKIDDIRCINRLQQH